jgi:hypothetical protein
MRLYIDAGLRNTLQDEHHENARVDQIAQHDG